MPRVVSDGSIMERLRADLLRRARLERETNLEEGHHRQSTQVPSTAGRGHNLRCRLNEWWNMGRRADRQTSGPAEHAVEVAESPKSTVFSMSLQASQTRHYTLPGLSQLWSRSPSRSASQIMPWAATGGSQSELPGPQQTLADMPNLPGPAVRATRDRIASTGDFAIEHPHDTGRRTDGEEQEARQTRREERRRRRGLRGNSRKQKHSAQRPKRFLGCFPWVKSRQMRAYIVRCFVSGLFLVLLLTIYLALSVSNRIRMGDTTIILVLIVILATLFFCYGLIKLCLLVVRKDRARQARALPMQDELSPGFAVPVEPIPVLLCRDQEDAGVMCDERRPTPPAYGIWRESVRVDPDRLFWQRNAHTDCLGTERPETRASRRPPSYSSDDGVSYVVDAVPRSVVASSMSAAPASHQDVGLPDGQRPIQ